MQQTSNNLYSKPEADRLSNLAVISRVMLLCNQLVANLEDAHDLAFSDQLLSENVMLLRTIEKPLEDMIMYTTCHEVT